MDPAFDAPLGGPAETDDTLRIQRAIGRLWLNLRDRPDQTVVLELYFPLRTAGDYVVSPIAGDSDPSMVHFPNMDAFQVTGQRNGSDRPVIRVADGVERDTEPVMGFANCKNFVIQDLIVDGNRSGRTSMPSEAFVIFGDVPPGSSHNVLIRSCQDFSFRNVSSVESASMGFNLVAIDTSDAASYPCNAEFDHCDAIHCANIGLSVTAGRCIWIHGGQYSYTNLITTMAGISLETLHGGPVYDTPGIFDVHIEGVHFEGNWKGVQINGRQETGVITVEGCTFIGSPVSVPAGVGVATCGGDCPGGPDDCCMSNDGGTGEAKRASGINSNGRLVVVKNNTFDRYTTREKAMDGIVVVYRSVTGFHLVKNNTFTNADNTKSWLESVNNRTYCMHPIHVWPQPGAASEIRVEDNTLKMTPDFRPRHYFVLDESGSTATTVQNNGIEGLSGCLFSLGGFLADWLNTDATLPVEVGTVDPCSATGSNE